MDTGLPASILTSLDPPLMVAMGAFVLALNPDAFLDRGSFDAGMRRYLDTLRRACLVRPRRPHRTCS